MIIYWSMLLIAPLVYLIYNMFGKKKVTLTDNNSTDFLYEKVPWIYAIIVFGYLIFWTGMRTYYADTIVYINDFNAFTTDWEYGLKNIDWRGKSPFFDLFTLFFKCFISVDFQPYLMTIAAFSGICIMVVLRKYSVDFFFSSYMFVSAMAVFWMMNGMRQFICVAIVFLCSKLLEEGKIVPYMIIMYLASYIHITILMMIPLYFVLRGSVWKTKTILFIIGIIVLSIFAEPVFGSMEGMLGEEYAGVISQYVDDNGVNPLRVGFYAIPVVLAYWRREQLSAYYEKYPILPICINASLVTACLYMVGVFSSGILIGRLPIYCELFNLILIPFIFKFGFGDNNEDLRKAYQYCYIALTVVFFWLSTMNYFYVSDITGYVW